MTPLGWRAPAARQVKLPSCPGAGQFDVETIRHAPVKLPAAGLLAKREAIFGPREHIETHRGGSRDTTSAWSATRAKTHEK